MKLAIAALCFAVIWCIHQISMLRNSKRGASDIRARRIPHPVKFFCLQVLKPSGKASVEGHCDSISPKVLSASENTQHSLRHWKVPQNSTLHRCIQAVNFRECSTLIHPDSNSDFYEHWRQIHEFGSATAACEILHRVTIDAKKRQESGAIIALPCTCYLCFTRSHPHSYPTPPS